MEGCDLVLTELEQEKKRKKKGLTILSGSSRERKTQQNGLQQKIQLYEPHQLFYVRYI